MADDVLLNAGTGGDTVAADDIAGVKYQRVKLIEGADGTNDGDISLSNPLPVEMPNKQASGALGALNAAVTRTVDRGQATIVWEIDTGTLVGTVVFEATLDDTNWFSVESIALSGSLLASTSSFPNRGHFTSSGYSQVRLRVSAYTSGTSNARIAAGVATDIVRLGEQLPAGTNAIGSVTGGAVDGTAHGASQEGFRAMGSNSANDLQLRVDNNGRMQVVGDAAHDEANGDSAVGIGGGATAALPTVVAEGDRVQASFDLNGQLRTTGEFVGTDGAAHGASQDGQRALSSDGTNDRHILSDTSGRLRITGTTAHDVADGGDPHKIGGKASAALPTAVGEADRVNASFDLQGQLRVTNETSDPLKVMGPYAHDSAVGAIGPVPIGAVSQNMDDTAPPSRVSAEGDSVRLTADRDGGLFVHPHGPQIWDYHVDGSSALTDATVHAAPGAGLSLYVTDIVFSSGAATAINAFLEEGATTVLGPYYLEAVAGRGVALHFQTPKKITANTALTITTSAAIAHSVDITGFVAAG